MAPITGGGGEFSSLAGVFRKQVKKSEVYFTPKAKFLRVSTIITPQKTM